MATQDILSSLPPYVRDLIPDSEICSGTFALAHDALPTPILNHSLRVYLLARWLAEKEGNTTWTDPEKLPLLFAAAICHDLGASDHYNGPQRFEVEGADAAKAHLLARGISEADSHQVWVAIAVHSSPGIAERIDPFSRLIRLAVSLDFSTSYRAELGLGATEYAALIEGHLPRLEAERTLADAVVKQAVDIPEHVDSLTWLNTQKHPSSSWAGTLLRAHVENPHHGGINPAF